MCADARHIGPMDKPSQLRSTIQSGARLARHHIIDSHLGIEHSHATPQPEVAYTAQSTHLLPLIRRAAVQPGRPSTVHGQTEDGRARRV